MVTVHIDYIHGDPLLRAPAAQPFTLGELVDAPEVIAAYPQAEEIKLHRLLGEPAWRVRTAEGPFLVNASTGEQLPPPKKAQVPEVACRIYTCDPPIVSTRPLPAAPLAIQAATPPLCPLAFHGGIRTT